MATESSDPRVGRIAAVAVLSLVTLIVVRTSLVAYFDVMLSGEEYRKIGSVKPEALMSLRADEKARLSSGPMPIEEAMQRMTTKGRMGAGPDVMPVASKDLAPMQGWTQMPAVVPSAMMASPQPAAQPSASASAAPSGSASAAPSGSAAAPPQAPPPKPPGQP